MTRVVDSVIAAFDAARPVFADAFHGDTYEVKRDVETPDDYGGTTKTPETVDSGVCDLEVAGYQGRERVVGERITAVGYYLCELPIDVDLLPTDTLIVNGRTFNVIDVKRGGELELFTTAQLEERS